MQPRLKPSSNSAPIFSKMSMVASISLFSISVDQVQGPKDTETLSYIHITHAPLGVDFLAAWLFTSSRIFRAKAKDTCLDSPASAAIFDLTRNRNVIILFLINFGNLP